MVKIIMIRTVKILMATFLVVASLPAAASDKIKIISVTESFSPTVQQTATVEVSVSEMGQVKLEILEPDGHLVNVVTQDVPEAGVHKLNWDGKDLKGQIVPNEAYSVRVSLLGNNGSVVGVDDPVTRSGGELLDELQATLNDTHIGFTLPQSARVLIRLGLKDGPMLSNLVRWEPRVAGKNRAAWNGFDASGVFDLRQDPRTTVLVVAYQLPDHSIITYGNSVLDYETWFENNEYTPRSVDPKEQSLARGEARIAREYYRSVYADSEPRITLKLVVAGEVLNPPFTISENAILKVDADDTSQWLLDESLYEVGFFVNGVFVSEEEQGYLPMSWRFLHDQIEPGEHLLTVNISGFDGRVGTASTKFFVK